MPRNHPAPNQQRPGGLPGPATAAVAKSASGRADLVLRRRVENSVSWSVRERLRFLWYRFRLEIADMNYAGRRLIELQIPWSTDPQWHMKSDPPAPR